MHGLGGEEQRSHRRHMWSVSAPAATSSVAATATTASFVISPDSFSKGGRKIYVGDCALFKPPHDSPPFVGIIRRLIPGKEDNFSLCVNWLYRPADVKLLKGVLLEAAPNEVFYSFHKDEIPAASLLHPCKVAFLRKGVELPSGVSSFVCRRVYDTESKCLWWLTDKNFINVRQEEVDQLLDKTRLEMYGALQSGGRSPKPLNGPTGVPQSKPGSDSVQNSSSSFPSQVKGKKREQGFQGTEPVKRERSSRTDDADSGQPRPDHALKLEIAKITDKGGLIDFDGVEKLVQLMQPDGAERKIDLACRIMLVEVIAVTDRFDCLVRFVQLRGLPVLDEWLQEVHKGKIGDGSSPKDSDRSVEEFLLALLRALGKLPVNLHALQTCNVGKSVNHLRNHKNSEIQKKARTLVDTWKKRVEAEMNMIDAKSGSSRGGSWPTKSVISEVSDMGSRRTGGSSEVGRKNSIVQSCSSKNPLAKLGSGEPVAKFPSASPGSARLSVALTTSGVASLKDLNSATIIGGGSCDTILATTKEEKCSSSSQSQNNSQSCSSDHGKTAASCREDARSSTAGSVSASKMSRGGSRSRKSSNGLHGSAISGVQKETGIAKNSSLDRDLTSEKASPTTHNRIPDATLGDNGNSQRLIVRLSNTSQSPARSASGGSPESASDMFCKDSSLVHSERPDQQDRKVKGKSDLPLANGASIVNMDSCQGKDGLSRSDELNVSSSGVLCGRSAEESKGTSSSCGMNALIESCVKFSEASLPASVGDDMGMNLLASVAAGEISRSDVSPSCSPGRKSPVPENACSGNNVALLRKDGDRARSEDQSNGGAAIEQGNCLDTLHVKNGQHSTAPLAKDLSRESEVISFGREEMTGNGRAHLNPSSMQNGYDSFPASGGKPAESVHDASAGIPEGVDLFHELRNPVAIRARSNNSSNPKSKEGGSLSEGDVVGCADEETIGKCVAVLESAATSVKTEMTSAEMCEEDKTGLNNQSGGTILMKQEPPPIASQKPDDTGPGNASCPILDMEVKAGILDDKSGFKIEQNAEQKMDLRSSVLDRSSEYAQENSEKKELLGHRLGGLASHSEPSAIPIKAAEQGTKSSGCKSDCDEADGAEEPASRVNNSTISSPGTDMGVKLDFDLNEGLPVDEGSVVELNKVSIPENSSYVHLPCPFPISIPPMSGSLPASVTVAAAAKGPFVPPDYLLRSKGELGWKGSAATSAFRPAEPRKILDMPLSTSDTLLADNNSSIRQGRTLLDFDLNVPDERILDDAVSHNSAPLRCMDSGPRVRSVGGLNLDLNRCDESPEIGQLPLGSGSKLEILKLPGRLPISSGFSNVESNASRDFDLNNGPGPDEAGSENTAHARSGMPLMSSFPGVRMNTMEIGNFGSWFPPGNSFSAIAMPPNLLGRGEQTYPLVPASGSQRIFGAGSSSFGPDIYRGAVLSSSPAIPFSSTSPFQYPGFPFETNFPLSSNTYSGGSTAYLESSAGGPLCFPAIPSQLVGPTGVVSTHYPRPYVMGLPGGTSNVGPESRKWASQGLDLNTGPGGTQVERRDERLPSALRQLPGAGSQALSEEQLKMYPMASGVLKRKEPEGGWDGDRITYKHSSWQ
ncbi:hypothetical protein RJ639_006583 [Escallonia herrerae]|uniref:Uncharacterized protein n=1 Tax=Escallonia herrerae TaxID=1293975 RepID=A0AA88VW24_9ASTE|nr:hypothetical protein RJ639_006583 [Escallonia herrerae]